MDYKATIVLLSLLAFNGDMVGVFSFPTDNLPIEMNGFDEDIKEDERPQDGDIGHFDPDDLVHHYTQEVLDRNRKITFDLKTGEVTYETDEEVIEILEMVRKDNSTHLISSFSIPNDTDRNLSLPEREERSATYIIGSDNRYKISNTSPYPHCAFGQLFNPSGSYCTLFMVGPYHALTAAHCVYDRSTRRHVTGSYAFIGRTCNKRGTRVDVRTVTTYAEYTRDGDEAYDYACLLLDRTDINTNCYMGFAYRDPMPTVSMTVCGYPCDKNPNPYRCMYCSNCNDARRQCSTTTTGWWFRKKTTTTCNDERIQYTCDIAAGVSGGPAYTSDHDSTSNIYAYGVHSHGHRAKRINLASRVSKKKFKDTCLWLQRNGGICNPTYF